MSRTQISGSVITVAAALALSWAAAGAFGQETQGASAAAQPSAQAADQPVAQTAEAEPKKKKSDQCKCGDANAAHKHDKKHGHDDAHDRAHHGHHKHRHGEDLKDLIVGQIGRYMVLRSKVELSHEDREKICSALGGHRQEIMKSIEDIWQKRNALEDSVLTGADEQAVRAAADDVGKAIGDAAVLATKIRGQIEPLLSDEEKHAIGHYIRDTREAIEKFYVKLTNGGHTGGGDK